MFPTLSRVSFHSLQLSAEDDGRIREDGELIHRVPAICWQEVGPRN